MNLLISLKNYNLYKVNVYQNNKSKKAITKTQFLQTNAFT